MTTARSLTHARAIVGTARQQMALWFVTAWILAVATRGPEQAHRCPYVRKARALYRWWHER